MISQMMDLAGYSKASQSLHRSFFSKGVAYSLGPYPTETGQGKTWNSFMTDDHTPLELSWSWSARDSTPAVRYAAEPIGWFAGSSADPMNTKAGNKCLEDALPWAPSMDLQWYRHFSQALVTTSETATTEKAPANSDSPSQTFIAFDLEEETMMVKYYFLPSCKAASLSKSNLSLAVESILSLQDLGHELQTPLGVVVDYISSFPIESQPHVLILAVDCLEPRRSRVKIYVRFHQTSFDNMIDAMSLGGALPSFSPATLRDLEDLWCSCFGVDHTSSPLENVQHRTAGLLYYYELRGNKVLPTSKVYLPVRHYATNDDQAARGVSDFLWKRGMTLKGGLSYYEGLSQIW
jgi:DMATS type aromatic prenyltransferase